MKKITLALVVVFTLLVFVGCASTGNAQASAGEWWNNPPADTAEYHYEVGTAKGSTVQTSRDWAKANANTALAQYISNTIDAIVVTYTNDAGETGAENTQALTAFESLSKQHAQATLTGVTYKYATDDDGYTYVLACLPIGSFAEQLKTDVQEAFVKNSASEEANKMMNEAIEKYFGGNVQ